MAIEKNDVDAERAVAALYLSSQFLKGSPEVGYVVFIDSDGGTQTIETSGMDVAQMKWTDDGLFFSDRDNDYLLTDTLEAIPSPKRAQVQSSAAYLGAGRGFAAVYNVGMGEEGAFRHRHRVLRRCQRGYP
ncbi:hypothetical protein [Nocardioides limicola]|uniref:hypothetical protein n=1 Tax=Nocardioides limicola TaxID=2803368 RepID=UPI00193BBEF5|nr:hypothetical protein [Nocardioides sp. DJM-14]